MRKNNKSKPLVIIQCYEDRQQTLPLTKSEPVKSNFSSVDQPQPKREATDNPPPPPPMPTTNGQQNSNNLNSMLKLNNENLNKTSKVGNGTLTRTPTPDYNSKTNSVVQNRNIKDEKAELESLESYKLKNPSNVPPKPPSNYFIRAPNGTATMKKHIRPVSVTIGEYSSASNSRREPSKLEFLNGDRPDGARIDDEPISNRLQTELVQTLSRSNLRKKTEALAEDRR